MKIFSFLFALMALLVLAAFSEAQRVVVRTGLFNRTVVVNQQPAVVAVPVRQQAVFVPSAALTPSYATGGCAAGGAVVPFQAPVFGRAVVQRAVVVRGVHHR